MIGRPGRRHPPREGRGGRGEAVGRPQAARSCSEGRGSGHSSGPLPPALALLRHPGGGSRLIGDGADPDLEPSHPMGCKRLSLFCTPLVKIPPPKKTHCPCLPFLRHGSGSRVREGGGGAALNLDPGGGILCPHPWSSPSVGRKYHLGLDSLVDTD